jgi:hypothetical protein
MAIAAFAPRLATPAQSYGLTHARYSIPTRLDGAHEAIRAYFALYGPKDLNCLRLAFTVRNRTAREASFLHNASLVCNPVEFTSQGGKAGLTPVQDNNTRISGPFRLDNVLTR